MFLPKNGRIIIVDDKLEEVKPLCDVLAKERIPFNYYSGSNDLPGTDAMKENPANVIFLDLNLIEAQSNQANIISTLIGTIKRISPPKPSPYLLIIWSKSLSETSINLETHFDKGMALHDYQPSKIVKLSKHDYMDKTENGWEAKDNIVKLLSDMLKTEINSLPSLGVLFHWESIVHNNTSNTIKELNSLYENNEKWDKNFKSILFSLAKSSVGKDIISSLSASEICKIALASFNTFLNEKVESDVTMMEITTEPVFDREIQPDAIVKSKIHSKLHLFEVNNSNFMARQGDLYFADNCLMVIKTILNKDDYNGTKPVTLIESNPKLVRLDITPVCDYAQNKKYVRLIYGVVLEDKWYKICKNQGDYYFQTPLLSIDNTHSFILFDFRHIISTTKEQWIKHNTLYNIKPQYRLGKEICVEIITKLANQISRPGFSVLE